MSAERCCRECRTPFQGVCREKQTCLCHYEQRAREKNTGRRPVADPTGNTAAGNVDRERRNRGRRRN